MPIWADLQAEVAAVAAQAGCIAVRRFAEPRARLIAERRRDPTEVDRRLERQLQGNDGDPVLTVGGVVP